MTPATQPQVCPFEADLKALLDGELPDLRRHQVEQHLAACASCTELRRHLRQLTVEVQAMSDPVSCPESVTDRVLNALPANAPSRLRWFEFSVVRWAAAGGFVTVMGAILVALLLPTFHAARESAKPASGGGFRPVSDATSRAYQDAMKQTASAKQGAPQAEMPGESGLGGGAPAAPAASTPMRSREVEVPGPPAMGRSNQFELNAEASRPVVSSDGAGGDVDKFVRGNEVDAVLRRVAKSATLGVEVNERLETLQERISKKVKADEGYVESLNLQAPVEGKGKRTSRMTLRVPVDRFEATIEYLSGLGEVTAKEMGGKDITGSWLDQRADVRTLRGKEEKYAAAYRNARTQVEREKARKQLLNLRPVLNDSEKRFAVTAKLAALARIDLTLTEEPQAKVRGDLGRDLQNTTRQASAAFVSALRVPATLLIWLAVFTPLWLPCLLVYRWATRMARRQEPSTANRS